jgi:16S rRNA (adenine1518-N6/adenine1519-N6)-dimethyltransferase
VRGVARRFRVGLRQRLGQHFLVDAHYRAAILEACALRPDDEVLEIGPGIGTLTQRLYPAVRRVVAVEIDPGCVAALRLTCRGATNLQVQLGDIRKVEVAPLFAGRPYRVIGNLPYYLTGLILPHLLAAEVAPRDVTVLVQREVAERMAAPPGDWSLATLGVRLFAEASVLLHVPAAAFLPPPRVASSLLRLTTKPSPALPRAQHARFFTLARALFQARRKQLHHTWARASGMTTAQARTTLNTLGIDPARRPQTLTLAEWIALYRALEPSNSGDTIRA